MLRIKDMKNKLFLFIVHIIVFFLISFIEVELIGMNKKQLESANFLFSTQTTTIIIKKHDNITTLETENFTLQSNNTRGRINIHFTPLSIHTHKKEVIVLEKHSGYEVLFNKITTIILSAKRNHSINQFSKKEYFDVSQSLINDIENLIEK